jgi:hypothetical protein
MAVSGCERCAAPFLLERRRAHSLRYANPSVQRLYAHPLLRLWVRRPFRLVDFDNSSNALPPTRVRSSTGLQRLLRGTSSPFSLSVLRPDLAFVLSRPIYADQRRASPAIGMCCFSSASPSFGERSSSLDKKTGSASSMGSPNQKGFVAPDDASKLSGLLVPRSNPGKSKAKAAAAAAVADRTRWIQNMLVAYQSSLEANGPPLPSSARLQRAFKRQEARPSQTKGRDAGERLG